jgi:hypothetical protein
MTWSRFNVMGASMKLVSSVILAILLIGSTSVFCYAVEGAMKGVDPTYRGGVTGVTHGGTGGGAKGMKCPDGTCSKIGTPYAKDVKYCSAANCKK